MNWKRILAATKALHCLTATWWADWRVYTRAMDWALVVWDMDEWLRGRIKHYDETHYENAREALYEIMASRGVSTDDIQ